MEEKVFWKDIYNLYVDSYNIDKKDSEYNIISDKAKMMYEKYSSQFAREMILCVLSEIQRNSKKV